MRLAAAGGGDRLMCWTMTAGTGPDWIIGLGHDRTDQQTDESRVRRTVGRLERRNEDLAARLNELEERYVAIERFAGTAAHQLAAPLVIAESSAILVADELGDDLDPSLRDRLDAIGRGAARARRLMDALLADARTEGLPPTLRPVAMTSVVDATLSSLEQQIEERRADVVVGPLPDVLGDARLLEVVLDNLVSNSLKYGPRSDGQVEITAERGSDDWRILVSSEGRPIPTEEAERIFQPFHRVPSERRVPGVGLGLTICARLMERLNGAIGVEPGTDSGNTFWISLPAADAASG